MSLTMSRRQLQPLQEYSEVSGFASSGTASGHGTWMGLLLLAQLQVMVHGWVSSVLHFSVPYLRSPGASRRRWDFCCSALGHISKVLFLCE